MLLFANGYEATGRLYTSYQEDNAAPGTQAALGASVKGAAGEYLLALTTLLYSKPVRICPTLCAVWQADILLQPAPNMPCGVNHGCNLCRRIAY